MASGLGRPISGANRPAAVLFSITKVLSIAGNTFTESVRQPVYAIIVGLAAAMIALSPYITMFTLQQSTKLMTDMGLATVMLAGLLLAAFTASNVISQEIENRTVLTVISKPIGRSEFIIGKFLGVMGGLFVGVYLLSLTLVLSVSGGAMEAEIEQELSFVVVACIFGSMLLAIGYGVYSNFFNDKPFASRTILAIVPLFTICFIVLGHYDSRATEGTKAWGAFGKGVDLQVVYACMMSLWSVLVLASIAIATSTRLAVAVNVTVCSGVFILGLLSEYMFRNLGQGSFIAGVLYEIVPNLQLFWVSDFLAGGVQVPIKLVALTAAYSGFQIMAYLVLAMLLFRNRQVA